MRAQSPPNPAAPLASRQRLLLAFPREDVLFRREAERRIRDVGAGDLRAGRRVLRRLFPGADLHSQRDVAIGRERRDVWFAFRDGRAQPMYPHETWWETAGVATCDLDSKGRLSGANAPARSLLGMASRRGPGSELAGLVGNDLASGIRTGSDPVAGQHLTSLIACRLPWGRTESIEMHCAPPSSMPLRRVSFRSAAERNDHSDLAAIQGSAFSVVAPVARAAAIRGRARRVLSPGDRLAEALGGEAWVALVVAGIIRVYMSVDGNEPTLVYGAAGAILGTHWLGAGPTLAIGMEAVTPSVVIQLDPRRVDHLIATDPAFALAVLAEGRGVTQNLALSYAATVATRLPNRLAREIVVLADLQPHEPFLPVTEQQLADGVGTIRESVGRAIAAFRRKGWLATTRYGILLLDVAALRELAGLPVPPAPAREAPGVPTEARRTEPLPAARRLLTPGRQSSGGLPARASERDPGA